MTRSTRSKLKEWRWRPRGRWYSRLWRRSRWSRARRPTTTKWKSDRWIRSWISSKQVGFSVCVLSAIAVVLLNLSYTLMCSLTIVESVKFQNIVVILANISLYNYTGFPSVKFSAPMQRFGVISSQLVATIIVSCVMSSIQRLRLGFP